MINRRTFLKTGLETIGLVVSASWVSELAIDNARKRKEEREKKPEDNIPTLKGKSMEYNPETRTLTVYHYPKEACSLKVKKTKPGYSFDTIYSKTESESLKRDYDSGIREKTDYPFKGCETNLKYTDRLIPLTTYPKNIFEEGIAYHTLMESFFRMINPPPKRKENTLAA